MNNFFYRVYIKIFSSIFFFILASFCIFYFYAKNPLKANSGYSIVQILPERLRSFIAAILWEKADHLMHEGPVVAGQKFFAGSYAGNTDIIPYIKMVITLCPKEVAPYRLLASNYAYHLGMKNEALNLIKEAISNCQQTPFLHELYASVAFIHLFSFKSKFTGYEKADLEPAEIYINKAIENYKQSDYLQDPVFKIENYYVVKARILWELDKPQQALDSWLMSGNKLEDSNDQLAMALLKYKQTGKIDKSNFPQDNNTNQNINTFSNIKSNNEQDCCSHDHEAHSHEEQQKSPLQALLWSILKAGFIAILAIISYFLYSKSFGTDSCAFQFSAGK